MVTSTLYDYLFRDESIELFLSQIATNIEALIPDCAAQLNKVADLQKIPEGQQNDARLQLLKRILYFIANSQQKSVDWERVTDNNLEDLLVILDRAATREHIGGIEEKSPGVTPEKKIFIQSLYLKNWLLFREKDIRFKSQFDSAQDQHNLIVFAAKNSEGKTSIFQALKMGLLGMKRFFELQDITGPAQMKKRIAEYFHKGSIKAVLAQTQNQNSAAPQTPSSERSAEKNSDKSNSDSTKTHVIMELKIKLLVTRKSLTEYDEYVIHRKWFFDVKDLNEVEYYDDKSEFSMNRFPGNMVPITEDTFNRVFEKLFPKKIQHLFLSEKLTLNKSLLEEKYDIIRDSTLDASNVGRFRELLDLYTRLLEFLKDKDEAWIQANISSDKEEIGKLQTENKRLSSEITKLDKEIKQNSEKVAENNKAIENARKSIADFNQTEYDKYTEIQAELARIDNERKAIQGAQDKKMKDIFVVSFFNQHFKMPDLRSIFTHLNSQLPAVPESTIFDKYDDYVSILRDILAAGKCLCDNTISSEMNMKFQQQIDKNATQNAHHILEHLYKHVEELNIDWQTQIKGIRAESVEYARLTREYNKKNKELEKINTKNFKADAKKILSEIDQLQAKNDELESKISGAQDELSEAKKKQKINEGLLKDLQTKTQDPRITAHVNQYARYEEFLEITQKLIQILLKKYEGDLRNAIQNLITTYFKAMDWESAFWQGFRIDSDWKLQFLDTDGFSYRNPSDGQKKLIMIAYISAILDLRPQKIPLIIDNVLAELSGPNIEGFAQQIIKNRSFPQQILFFTDTEWDTISPKLNAYILQRFLLTKTSATETTLEDLGGNVQ